jgi:hypothetical protein
MCLIKGRETQKCTHWWCAAAAKKPEWFGLFKADYLMNREGLNSFDLHRPNTSILGSKADSFLLPHNAYTPGSAEHNDFEIFRQAQTSTARVAGYWPADRTIFAKSEVKYIFVERTREVRKYIIKDDIFLGEEWVSEVDVTEVAVYIGEGSDYGQ